MDAVSTKWIGHGLDRPANRAGTKALNRCPHYPIQCFRAKGQRKAEDVMSQTDAELIECCNL
jgi:hypothetical protein